MARDTIDAAIQEHNLKAGSCKTMGLQLEGAQDWSPTLYIRLVQDYGLESEVSPGFPCWRGLAFPKIKHQHNLDRGLVSPIRACSLAEAEIVLTEINSSNCSSSSPFSFLLILTVSCLKTLCLAGICHPWSPHKLCISCAHGVAGELGCQSQWHTVGQCWSSLPQHRVSSHTVTIQHPWQPVCYWG